MPRVVISGYYGFNNIGDEAVLAAIVETLQKEIPEVKITVLSANPSATAKQLGVRAVNRWKLGRVISAINRCDLFISGGGSLLQDVTGPRSVIYYLGLIWLAKVLKKPVMLYAQGIGPVNRPWARKLVAQVVNMADVITVRDEDSADDLRDMGVYKDVTVTVDPVLAWTGEEGRTAVDNLCRAKVADGPCIGISLRSWPGMDLAAMAEVCDYVAARGFQVVFLPFHFPEDIAVSREVVKLMKQESFIIKENLSPAEMMDAVGRMKLIIGMRLHALIMAAAKEVPFVAVSYDPKVERFAGRMGQSVACSVETMKCADLIEQVEKIFQHYYEIKEQLAKQVRELQVLARKTGEIAKEQLRIKN